VPLYAALRSLGRSGLAKLIDDCCDYAEQMAARLADADGVEVPPDSEAFPRERLAARMT
jgi:glutamate/tyrosine decarboxylase-like PLP-dependent enzyme